MNLGAKNQKSVDRPSLAPDLTNIRSVLGSEKNLL